MDSALQCSGAALVKEAVASWFARWHRIDEGVETVYARRVFT